jgi:hypothetical protein
MAVLVAAGAQVRPGRLNDAVAFYAQTAKALERHGVESMRLFRTMFSAEAYGTLMFSMEFPSFEAAGASNDSVMQDDEILGQMAISDGADSPFAAQSMVSAVEIPIGGRGGRGEVAQVFVARVRPGRLPDAIDESTAGREVFERLGATGSRLFQMLDAGAQTRQIAFTAEFPSMKAWGTAADGLMTDPAAVDLGLRTLGADGASDLISTTVYLRIPT